MRSADPCNCWLWPRCNALNLHFSKVVTGIACLLVGASLNIQHDTTRIVLHFLCVMIFWTQVSHYEPWFPAWSQTYHFAPAAHFVFHLTFYLILGNSWSLLWGVA
eukprot:g32121.t1